MLIGGEKEKKINVKGVVFLELLPAPCYF